ncbi:MAG: ATP-binding protein [Chitinophagaceae bacterium]
MHKIIFCLSLLIAAYTVHAQPTEIEQLRQEIADHPQQDTLRVNRLIKLAYILRDVPDQVERLATEAMTISQKIDYTTGIGYAFLRLAYADFRKNRSETWLVTLAKADSIADLLKDMALKTEITMNRALEYRFSDPKKALDLYTAAEKIATESNNLRLVSATQMNIGSIYTTSLANYPKAMEYILKSLRNAEQINYSSGVVSGYRALGNLYTYLGDEQTSLVYFQKAAEANKRYGDRDVETLLFNDMGESFRLTGRYPEAITNYQKGLQREKRSDRVEVGLSNLADVYVRIDSLDSAFHYGFSSLAIAKDIEDDEGMAWINGILSRAYLKKNMPDSAIYYATKGLNDAMKTGNVEYKRDNTEALANAYAYKKDFANAYKHYRDYVGYRDSTQSATVANKATVLQHEYDREKQEAQINALNQQKKIQRNFLISALVVMVLIIITAILLLRANRKQQKANILLQQQKHEIDVKANELTIQKANVELLGEIGHKINSSLSIDKIISTVYNNVNTLMDAAIFGIGIYNERLKRIEFPATWENGQPLPFYTNEMSDDNRFAVVCLSSGKEINMGNMQNEYKSFVQHIPIPHEGGQPVSVIFLPLIAKEKKLGVITVQSFKENAYSDYHLYMLRNIAVYTAIALENAESYEELTNTLDTLKTTQTQLVQSEKMASLGELTAGIAHEIQNPLNFVNNFSEVSNELMDEMLVVAGSGDLMEVKTLAGTIRQNLEKINFHGRRADAIVKGMLQHSRQTAGTKEPTDINALCDEYIRLSYHGLRAKDNSFNADFRAELDPSIGTIPIVQQDFGRVLINLLNNAFYAVREKAILRQAQDRQAQGETYKPAVTVSTKKQLNNIAITITDNGNGIPKDIIDKIFQPFFTTKPSGSGTGLGLSLAYDIITKEHNGTIQAESKEGEGAQFIIMLPAV